MKIKESSEGLSKSMSVRKGKRTPSRPQKSVKNFRKFSPTWVVYNMKDTPGHKLELIDRIREGVNKADWKELIDNIGATEKELAFILPNSISSMQKNEIYGKNTSERIYELAKLFGLGYQIFDSREDFKKWLMTPSIPLGNKKPFELLDSSLGFELVENEIIRIQYNVYS